MTNTELKFGTRGGDRGRNNFSTIEMKRPDRPCPTKPVVPARKPECTKKHITNSGR